jgi:hypothetical protein
MPTLKAASCCDLRSAPSTSPGPVNLPATAKMMFQPALLLAILPLLTFASPITNDAAPITAQGSKHTVYLTHCQPKTCIIFCDPDDDITAVAYFAGGPIATDSTGVQKPTDLGRISGRTTAFEGTQRSVKLGKDGTFTSNINASAKTAAKGSIAGDGTLVSGSGTAAASEPFVCFKDGTSVFTVNYDDQRYDCTTDYYCPSIDVGSGSATPSSAV